MARSPMFRSFSDDEVVANEDLCRENAKHSGKEGKGMLRNAGDSGRVHNEWFMWRQEAIARGLK